MDRGALSLSLIKAYLALIYIKYYFHAVLIGMSPCYMRIAERLTNN